MSIDLYLLYVVAILVLTASPGPSILLCITKSVTQNFAAAVYAALGSLSAMLMIMTLSFTGLGVLIASSDIAFTVVKWIGAAYLVYLGVKMFFSESRTFDTPSEVVTGAPSRLANFASGFVVGATNPKAIIFFTALFPQFIDTTQPLLIQYLILVSSFAVLEFGWLLTYAYFGSKSSRWLQSKGRAKFFNRLTGSVFVGAGVLLSTVKRT